jgi:outer membrane protein TolC
LVSTPQSATLPEYANDQNESQFPIDLPTTLRLAGANNLQIAVAYQKVLASRARLQGATALWLPSLEAGMGYNKHSGRIQDTFGNVIDVNRESAFVGGGPNFGEAPLTGASNGPARLFIGLPLTDAIFERLSERQRVNAAGAHQAATFNDMLLAASVGYFDLVRSQIQVAIANEAVTNAQELARVVEVRARGGTAPPADELRAQAELADRQRRVFTRWESVRDTSANLVRVLNLEGGTNLFAAETQPIMIDLVDLDRPLPELLAIGLSARPEMAQHRAQLAATLERLRQEKWRPLLPNLQVGFSGGGFGGGRDGFFGDWGSRGDFDALAVWELRNLGFGNAALIRERRSQAEQARLSVGEVRNAVAAEIVRSYYAARLRRDQVQAALRQMHAAAEALPLNFKGILGGQLRAIEGLQAVDALTAAQTQYLESIIDYNRAQFALLRALGNPPDPQSVPQLENLAESK